MKRTLQNGPIGITSRNTAVIHINNCIAKNKIHKRTVLMSPYDLNALNDIPRILHSASHAINP